MSSFDKFLTTRRGLFRDLGVAGGALAMGNLIAPAAEAANSPATGTSVFESARAAKFKILAADPLRIPPPIHRDTPMHHTVTLTVLEHEAELSPGARYRFMTFNGQIPGPMIRVRQGDTVTFTLENPLGNTFVHSVDMHAIFGSGGGADALVVAPGERKTEVFQAMYPGAFVYHCAVAPDMDMHISCGMYGMILVEPEDGLPKVDREFYLGQNEVYTDKAFEESGLHLFDFDRLIAENPTYVLLNGAASALTQKRLGSMKAKVGETVRIFFVNGGPNLSSSFHPIGNVWLDAWPQGGLANSPLHYIQTQSVPPGSAFVGHLRLPVPETIKLVDHSLTRVSRKGCLAEIIVEGTPNPVIYRS